MRDLPQLKLLVITGFDKLRTLDGDPKANQTVAFPKLEQLQISKMKKLHSLLDIEGQHLPSLQRISISECPELTTIPSCLKESMTLARFEIDEESHVGVKNMLLAFREGIVLKVRVGCRGQSMNETTKMPEAARDLEPVPIAGINVTSNDGDHVLFEDAGTNSGASGDNESMFGAILEGDINDAGPMVAVVNEAALGNGDNLIVHQAVAGEHNLTLVTKLHLAFKWMDMDTICSDTSTNHQHFLRSLQFHSVLQLHSV